MLCVEREFVGDVLPAQRLLRAAAQMWLPLLGHAAVLHGGPYMAGIVARIWIVRVDDVFHFCRQREHLWIVDRGFAERAEPNTAVYKARRQQIRRCEFGGVAVARALLVRKRLPKPVHRAFRHLTDDLADVLRLHAAGGKASGAVDI